jgi:serine/threonine protein kinase
MHEVINGYRRTTEWSTAGGGQCQWAFAERDGVVYFLKRFLAPRYPVKGSPGSAATKAKKLERCRAFEEHHGALNDALRHRCASGGNLVVARDFFREGTTYYKVTDRVDTAGLTPGDIASLPFDQQLLLLKTVTHSVAILHEARIVHSDLRPENVLVKRASSGFVTKLIDFDNAYFSEAPPPTDQVAADPIYLAPEMSRYTAGLDSDPRALTVKADVFSLGLVFAMFTIGGGAFSEFTSHGAQYAHEFIEQGKPVPLPWDRMPAAIAPLVRRMIAAAPTDRPTTREILDILKGDARAPELKPRHGKLRGTLVSASRPAAPPPAASGGLRGTLIGTRR